MIIRIAFLSGAIFLIAWGVYYIIHKIERNKINDRVVDEYIKEIEEEENKKDD